MGYSVCCDFDGTISIGDIGNRLFRTFATESIDEILDEWKQGDIDSRECLRKECDLVEVTKKELTEFADKQKIEASFKRFYEYCRKREWNFKQIFLDGSVPDGNRTVGKKEDCIICGKFKQL